MRLPWVGTTEYSEQELALRAILYALPVPLILLAWDLEIGWKLALTRAVALWLAAAFTAYMYGHWVREDEDDE
jgi:hypothetical protein